MSSPTIIAAQLRADLADRELVEKMLRYARTKARVDAWTEPMRGDLFERRIACWRSAMMGMDRAATAARLAHVKAYLALRKQRSSQKGAS